MQPLDESELTLCTTESPPAPSLLRRLAAITYDSLILLGLWLLADLLFVLVADATGHRGWPRWLFQSYLWLVAYGFFSWFWLHGGQTLGMRVWRLQLVSDGAPLTPARTLVRFAAATLSCVLFGLGFLWMLVDPRRQTWHDRVSSTHLILLPAGFQRVRANK